MFFPKRGEEKFLICRAAVKPVGRSPKSKPTGVAWLDGSAKANQYNASRPLGKNNSTTPSPQINAAPDMPNSAIHPGNIQSIFHFFLEIITTFNTFFSSQLNCFCFFS
ncbi:MAG: hypothetical protein IJ599_01570 [Alphaproteobacteria bacterium]|nr:hypothetical protein [Alphaproteobacteria bacterium]